MGRPTISRTSSGSVTSRVSPSPTFSPSRRHTQRSDTRKISSNLCQMKTMARPSAFNCATIRKRSSISCRESAAVGSSMMTTPRVMAQRARDLHHVLLRHRQRLQRSVRVEIRFDAREQLARRLARIAVQSTRRAAGGMCPMKMFSATLNSSNMTVSWWIAVMPGRPGVARRVRSDRSWPVDRDLALVRRVDAGQDLDERRFAGAVLADQRGDVVRHAG